MVRCPYYFSAEVFDIEVSKNVFIVTAKIFFDLPGYSMKRFKFELLLLLNEVIYYQKNLGGRVDSSLEIRNQGNYNLTNFYLQNFTDSTIEVKIGEIIGRIFVGCTDNLIINPCSRRRDEMIQILDSVTSSQINADNFSMITAISDMLEA